MVAAPTMAMAVSARNVFMSPPYFFSLMAGLCPDPWRESDARSRAE
jgi:hypothetical protein